jgi:hypothetical protein
MCVIPEAALLHDDIRVALDRRIVEQAKLLTEQRATDYETYLVYFATLGGLREARKIVDDTIRKANEPE